MLRRWVTTGFWLGLSLAAVAAPFGTAFTFQGRMTTTNGPADGLHDLDFGLWDRSAGGTLLGTRTFEEFPVSNGLFTVELDFGAGAFAGAAERFVEVIVKRTDSTNAAVALAPRTRVAPAPYAVLAGEVPDGSIGTAKIAPGAIDGNRIANGAVGFSQLGTWAVDLDKIADHAVTSNKLAPDAVHSFHLVTGAVVTASLAEGAVTTPKLAGGAVTAPKIAAGAVSNQHLAAGSVGSIHLLANSVTSAKIADGAIVSADLAEGAVDFAQLAKPYRSGFVSFAGQTNTFAPGPFAIAFAPAFASPPIVTFGVMPATNGGPAYAELAGRSATGCTVRLRGEARPEPVAAVVTSRIGRISPGVVLDDTERVPACVYALYESGLFSSTPRGFVFARGAAADGRSWTNRIVNTNASTAALLADGANTPLVAYTERLGASPSKGLFAIRASLPNGAAWSAPVNCDPTSVSVEDFDVALVGGRPALLYTDVHASSNAVQLKYVRANDAIGATWGTPRLLASSTYFFAPDLSSPQLRVVAGNPAAYYGLGASTIRAQRATDATGANWGPATNVASALTYAELLDVAVVGGQPVVLAHQHDEAFHRYYRAKDATGTEWWPPWVAGHKAVGTSGAQLIETGGRPGLAWSANGLHYAEAAYAQGSGWHPRVRIHDAVDAGGSRLFWIGNGLAAFVRSDDQRRLDYLWSGPAPAELQWTAVLP